MSATDWDLFEDQKRPDPSWRPWLDVGSANTLFERASTEQLAEPPVVRIFAGGESGLSFAVVPAKAVRRWRFAGTRDFIVRWQTEEPLPEIDRSPIRDFREERVQEARHAAMLIARDGHLEIADRLAELIDLANAEWPHSEIPSPQAIQTLGRLLRRLHVLRAPEITLTDNGQLWVQWSAGGTQVAVIIGSEGVPAIAALLPDTGSIGRAAHLNFCGSEEQVADRLTTDPGLRVAVAR